MAPDKLTPTDPRVQHHHVLLNGLSYHYLLATPPASASPPRATIFLIHGWPDCSFGWRYQIPLLLSLRLRVVVPDMLGYNLSAAPSSLEAYTFKRAADDLAALAHHLGCAPRGGDGKGGGVILLGHDWGGAIVYRVALWHPRLVRAVLSICTPYARPSREYAPLEKLVEEKGLSNFRYQLQLASGVVEEEVRAMGEREGTRMFLNAVFGGKGPEGEVGFVAEQGLLFENWKLLRPSSLLSPQEMEYYTEAYMHNGLRGPLNWYRTRELNFRDEKAFLGPDDGGGRDLRIMVPVLFVVAKRDQALPPRMSRGMERNFDDLTVREVDAGHWALWQRPEECNELIETFLAEEVFGGDAGGGGKSML